MKVIPLTQGQFAKVSDEDYERVMNCGKWCASNTGGFYAVRRFGQKLVYMHHFIFGAKPVDHKDGDGLNNQRENLRVATASQNNCNKGIRIDNKTGVKCVTLNKRTGRFRVCVSVNGRRYEKEFDTIEEASADSVSKLKELHGEFFRTN